MKIVLVDDEPLTLEALRRLLVRAGHAVLAYSNGAAALDWLSHNRPDLVILDIVMPEMSGYDVCRRLRARARLRDVPVVFLTSKDRTSDMAEASASGSDLFVTKPVLAARLLKMVADLQPQPAAAAAVR
jgi:DNA-binding response OmpR family regulator